MRQANSSKDIAQSIGEISGVAHETASGVHQIARTAEDLDRLTENLQQLTKKFKLSSWKNDTIQPPPGSVKKISSSLPTRSQKNESGLRSNRRERIKR
jgi:hypothetical protein